jgi:hypothetical protein
MYVRTTEYLVDYVSTKFGREMKKLVKFRREGEADYSNPPDAPDSKTRSEDGLAVIRYKEMLTNFNRNKEKYLDQKAQVMGVILGQCTQECKSRLATDPNFKKIEMEDDVAGLLELIERITHTSAGAQEPFWAMQEVLRRFMAINQGKRQTIERYQRNFMIQANVIAGQWGLFYPPKLAKSDSDADKEAAHQAFLARIFLAGADNHRFRGLKEDLNNQYLSKKDNYPATVQEAATLLTFYQDHRLKDPHEKISGKQKGQVETSFAQRQAQRNNNRGRPQAQTTEETKENETRERGSSQSRSRSPPRASSRGRTAWSSR